MSLRHFVVQEEKREKGPERHRQVGVRDLTARWGYQARSNLVPGESCQGWSARKSFNVQILVASHSTHALHSRKSAAMDSKYQLLFQNSQDLQAIDLAVVVDLVPITQFLKMPYKTYTWYLTFIDVMLWKVPSLLVLADDPVARQAAEAILKVIDEEGAPCSDVVLYVPLKTC